MNLKIVADDRAPPGVVLYIEEDREVIHPPFSLDEIIILRRRELGRIVNVGIPQTRADP
jgi:hypothetical protein